MPWEHWPLDVEYAFQEVSEQSSSACCMVPEFASCQENQHLERRKAKIL